MLARSTTALFLVVLVAACSDTGTSTSSSVTEPMTATTPMSTLAPVTTTSLTSTTTATAPTTTTTAAPAPPLLEVTDPVNGATVTSHVYTFRGVTDPGCTVSVADKYYADVDPEGNWTLDLKLRPSGNTTTFVASDPAGHTTNAQITVTYRPDLVLRANGFGPFDFGDRTATVVVPLQDLLGLPSPGEEYPHEDHPLRHVYWEDVGLAVVFSDYGFFRDDGHEHLVGWVHSPSIGLLAGWDDGGASTTLRTVKGIGVGSTLAELQSAYPERVVLEAECDPGGPPTAAYVRFSESDRGSHIVFGFDGHPLEASSLIVVMSAGAGHGC